MLSCDLLHVTYSQFHIVLFRIRMSRSHHMFAYVTLMFTCGLTMLYDSL